MSDALYQGRMPAHITVDLTSPTEPCIVAPASVREPELRAWVPAGYILDLTAAVHHHPDGRFAFALKPIGRDAVDRYGRLTAVHVREDAVGRYGECPVADVRGPEPTLGSLLATPPTRWTLLHDDPIRRTSTLAVHDLLDPVTLVWVPDTKVWRLSIIRDPRTGPNIWDVFDVHDAQDAEDTVNDVIRGRMGTPTRPTVDEICRQGAYSSYAQWRGAVAAKAIQHAMKRVTTWPYYTHADGAVDLNVRTEIKFSRAGDDDTWVSDPEARGWLGSGGLDDRRALINVIAEHHEQDDPGITGKWRKIDAYYAEIGQGDVRPCSPHPVIWWNTAEGA